MGCRSCKGRAHCPELDRLPFEARLTIAECKTFDPPFKRKWCSGWWLPVMPWPRAMCW